MNDGQSPSNPQQPNVNGAEPQQSAPNQAQPTQQVAQGLTGGPAAPVAPTTPQQPVVMNSKQIGKYLVEVINDKCIGAASCVAIAPEVFQLNEDNIAYVISQDGNDDDTKLLAAQSCPTAAIIVTDTTTGQQVWPHVDA